MKAYVVLSGALLCLGALCASQPGRSPAANGAAAKAQQALTGCIDEQRGKYVLLDEQMVQIVRLQSVGADQEIFARHLGHKVKVVGTRSSGEDAVFKVSSVETLESRCVPAK
jgi:hypothetical protein